MPKQLVIHLIYYVVMFLNAMPAKTGISDTISPREIVMRRRLDWNKHCTGEFGKYVEAHSDPDITNTNKTRTFAGIYLGITGNIQGTKKVFDLKTGTVKKCRSVTVMPMPDRIINTVNAWGKRYQEEEKKNKIEFLNRVQLQYDWDNDELEVSEGLMEELAHPDLSAQFPGIELERELDDGATSAMTIFEPSTEQEAHDAAVNGNLIEPITQAPVGTRHNPYVSRTPLPRIIPA